MLWGYLSEFWDAITQVGDYTIEWFESIGNAVAGAIGGLFSDLTHHFYDVFYLVQWFLSNLGSMMSTILAPLFWVFNFTKGFLASATSSMIELGIEVPQIELVSSNVSVFFNAIPYFSLLLSGISGALGLFIFIFILKKIIQI